MDAIKKVTAIAVTGGPNNLPILVCLPIDCATDADPVNASQLPHTSLDRIRLVLVVDNCSSVDVVVLVDLVDCCRECVEDAIRWIVSPNLL
jgi:hypothetical protein